VTTDDGNAFVLEAYVPETAGARPIVSISPGLQQPAVAYTSFGERLASHGFLVLIRDDPGAFTQTPEVAGDLAWVIATWLPTVNDDVDHPLFGRVDVERVGLAGHSRGGKASLVAAEGELADLVHAWFGLDPVDAATLGDGVFARDGIGTIGIPTAFLGATVSSSCSPASDNYEVLYAAASSPSVKISGIGAGHTQLEDQDGCVACNFCVPAGTADPDVVIGYARRYLTAFFARELLGDAAVGAAFEGAGALVDVADGRVEIDHK
jgi:dienelactone hydrolase